MTSPKDTVEAIELRLLSALCAQPDGPGHESCAASLGSYRWRNAEHQVVYEAVRRIGFLPPPARRRELPAEVTRLGFPDVDCSAYFDSGAATPNEIAALIARLQELAR